MVVVDIIQVQAEGGSNMAYDFGSALGKGIERGAESIAGGMREKFKKQYEAQKEKTNRAREEYMFLMQQGGTPTAEMAQEAQLSPGLHFASSDIVRRDKEARKQKGITTELERDKLKAQTGLAEAKAGYYAKGGKPLSGLDNPTSKSISDKIYKASGIDPKGKSLLTPREASMLLRISNVKTSETNQLLRALGFFKEGFSGKLEPEAVEKAKGLLGELGEPVYEGLAPTPVYNNLAELQEAYRNRLISKEDFYKRARELKVGK